MPKHTPEPWFYEYGEVVVHRDDERVTVARAWREPECPIPPSERDRNMARIAACVTACAGLNQQELDGLKLARLLKMLSGYVRAYRDLTMINAGKSDSQVGREFLLSAVGEADVMLATIYNLLAEDKD